jgi:hypothetical protein
MVDLFDYYSDRHVIRDGQSKPFIWNFFNLLPDRPGLLPSVEVTGRPASERPARSPKEHTGDATKMWQRENPDIIQVSRFSCLRFQI